MELVSVIIPAFNAAGTVGRAIESVLAQTHRDLECIVVNDGSTDGTEAVVRRYPDVVYHCQENRGLAGTRNVGAGLARGEYLALLDADDEWLPDKLQRQLDVLRHHPQAAAVSTHRVRVKVDAEGRELWRQPSRRADGRVQEIGFAEEFWSNRICGATTLFRKACFEQHGGYDDRLLALEDLDLWLRILAAGDQLLILREPLYVFTERPGSLRANLDKVSAALAVILDKWDPATNTVAAGLMDQGAYRETCQWWWLKLAFHALRQGNKPRASEFARKADSLHGGNNALQAAVWLAVHAPLLFYAAGKIKGFPRTTG